MSSIRKRDIYEYDTKKRNTNSNRKKNLKTKIKKKKKSVISFQSFKNLMMIISVFIFGLVIIFNYAMITDKNMTISNINDEIELLSKEKEEILITLESIKNTNIIEEKAKNYLGMNYPTRAQTEFIDVTYTKEISIEQYAENEKSDSYITSFLEIAGDLFD